MPITISGKAVGSRRPLFADWSIPLPPDDFGAGRGLTLRDLITIVVERELEAFSTRNQARRLDRVLTPGQIADGAAAGRIAPEGRPASPAPALPEAVSTALQAFEDGLYLVIIDQVEHRRLDDPVSLVPNSRVVFLRLTFLAGA